MGRMHNPPHPGESIREDILPALELSVTEAAKQLGVARVTLSRLIHGRSGISADMARRLEAWLGGPKHGPSAESWLRMQADYDLWQAMQKPAPKVVRAQTAALWPYSSAARDEFEYGPDGQRYYRKSTWEEQGEHWVVHRFYVGDFEELITDTRDTANAASQKSRIGASVLHLKRIDRSSLEYESIQYLHRIQVLIQRRFD